MQQLWQRAPWHLCLLCVSDYKSISSASFAFRTCKEGSQAADAKMVDSCSWIVWSLCLVECNLSNNIRLVIYLEGTVWIGQYYEMLIFSDREHKPVVFFGVAFVVSLVVSDTVVSAVSAVSGVISTPERYCFFFLDAHDILTIFQFDAIYRDILTLFSSVNWA